MRMPTFNKAVFKCPKCGNNEVDRWDKLCKECKDKTLEPIKTTDQATVGRRMPAAIIETEDGQKVFVDKNGKEVKNHGYNLDQDPRGWERNGRMPKKRKII